MELTFGETELCVHERDGGVEIGLQVERNSSGANNSGMRVTGFSGNEAPGGWMREGGRWVEGGREVGEGKGGKGAITKVLGPQKARVCLVGQGVGPCRGARRPVRVTEDVERD